MHRDSVEIAFDEIVHSTDLTWLVDFGFKTEWVPASQCKINEEDKVVEMPEWLAIDRN